MANKEQQLRYKGNRCAGCGMPVDEIVARYGTFERLTQFHHIDPENKASNYKNLIRQRISTEQLEELDKCALLCSGCHDIIHAQSIRGKLALTVQIDGRDVTQTFDGWYKLDNLDKKMVFISNEPLLLNSYRVLVGSELEKILCGIELHQEDVLANWLVDLDEHKTIEISSMDGRKMFCAEHLEGRHAKLSQDIGFPVTMIDLSAEERDPPYLWVRNGMMLNEDGSIETKGTLSMDIELRDKKA
jgi:hypothetical protein